MKAKTEVISLRLTPEEKRRLEYSAEKNGKEPVIYPDHSIKCILQICPEESGRCNRRIDLLECTHNHCKRSHGAAADTKRQQPSRKETTMQYKDWDGNLLPDPAPRIHNVHTGTIIKTEHKIIEEPLETRGRGQHRFISDTREYEVIAVYPHMVQTRDRKTGFTRCFSYGELTTMGLKWKGRRQQSC